MRGPTRCPPQRSCSFVAALTGLVGPDRDVLGTVIGGQLATSQRNDRRGERRESRDGLAGGEIQRAAPRQPGCSSTQDHRHGDARPLEREARLGQRPANVGKDGERLGQAQWAPEEGSRHIRGEASLGTTGGANRSSRRAHRRTPCGGTVDEHAVRECHAAESQLLHDGEGTVRRWTFRWCSS